MYYGPMDGYGWGFGIFSFLWLIFIIFIIYAFIRWMRHGEGWSKGSYHQTTTPIDIAKERYAKGEITKEQFEQIKKDLK